MSVPKEETSVTRCVTTPLVHTPALATAAPPSTQMAITVMVCQHLSSRPNHITFPLPPFFPHSPPSPFFPSVSHLLFTWQTLTSAPWSWIAVLKCVSIHMAPSTAPAILATPLTQMGPHAEVIATGHCLSLLELLHPSIQTT